VLDGAYSPIVITKDIYIGTVKLCVAELRSCTAALYNQSYPVVSRANGLTVRAASAAGSELSLTEVIASACAIAPHGQPSAPEFDPLAPEPDPLVAIVRTSDTSDHQVVAPECPRSGVVPFREDIDRPPPFAPEHKFNESFLVYHQ